MKRVSPRIWKTGLGALMGLCLVCSAFGQDEASVAEPGFAPRLGICTAPDKFEILKTNGFDYLEAGVGSFLIPVESDEKFAERFAAFEAAGFPIEACNGFIPGNLKSTGPDADHDAVLAYAETAFRRAQQVGIKVIVFGSGSSRQVPDGFDPSAARQQFVALLKRMGPIAARYDVTVVIEPLNKKECNFINSVSEGTDIAREVNHPNIKVLADLYHMVLEDEGPDSILKAGKDLRHCHIAEREGRAAPGVQGDDFTAYFRALKQIGYKGRISIECGWKDMQKQAPTAIQTIREQIRQVNAEPPVSQ